MTPTTWSAVNYPFPHDTENMGAVNYPFAHDTENMGCRELPICA